MYSCLTHKLLLLFKGYFMRILIEVFKDIASFTLFTGVMIIGFGMIYYNQNNRNHFSLAIWRTYNAIYGNQIEEDYDTPVTMIFNVFISVLMNIILFNLIISFMANSFARVRENLVSSDAREKAYMLFKAIKYSQRFKYLDLRNTKCLKRKEVLEKGYMFIMRRANESDDIGSNTGLEDQLKTFSLSLNEMSGSIKTLEVKIGLLLEKQSYR